MKGLCSFDVKMMPGPRKKNLRLAIKKMAIASPEKVLREEAIFNLAHVLHERPGWRLAALQNNGGQALDLLTTALKTDSSQSRCQK